MTWISSLTRLILIKFKCRKLYLSLEFRSLSLVIFIISSLNKLIFCSIQIDYLLLVVLNIFKRIYLTPIFNSLFESLSNQILSYNFASHWLNEFYSLLEGKSASTERYCEGMGSNWLLISKSGLKSSLRSFLGGSTS